MKDEHIFISGIYLLSPDKDICLPDHGIREEREK